MDQMMLGQVLSRLNTLEELILQLGRQVQAIQQTGSGDDVKLDELLQKTTVLQLSVDGLGEKTDTLLVQSEETGNNVNTLLVLAPDMKCRFPGGKPENAKTTKKIKGE